MSRHTQLYYILSHLDRSASQAAPELLLNQRMYLVSLPEKHCSIDGYLVNCPNQHCSTHTDRYLVSRFEPHCPVKTDILNDVAS